MGERAIIDMLSARDEAGLAALLRHYGPLMRYVIAPILPNPQDQEECLSETALRVWAHIGQFDPQRGNWRAWLTAVTRNTALNHRRGLRNSGSLEDCPGELPSQGLTPEEQVLRQERREAVQRAVRGLSEGEQVLFYRKYYYLQSTAQMAAELGLTERAVEGRLYRLREKLRRQLGGVDHG